MGSGIKKGLSKPGIGHAQKFKTGSAYRFRTQEPPRSEETGLKHATKHPVVDPIDKMGPFGNKQNCSTGGRRS